MFSIKDKMEWAPEQMMEQMFKHSDLEIQHVIALLANEFIQTNWSKLSKESSLAIYKMLLDNFTQRWNKGVIDPYSLTFIRLSCKIGRIFWVQSSFYKVGNI